MVKQDILKEELLFEVEDIFGKKVRITKRYWEEIKTRKHTELEFEMDDIIGTLAEPDEVRLSVQDAYIRLFFKQFDEAILIVVVKYLNGNGFVVTVYQTSKVKRKGEIVWSRKPQRI
ncbi:DUF4258 domain-containing protein [Candidatus Gottesmanbacteria bacterium]|nr:DUF4258 domain-containing protein [Candidatus Gottesmanbacteria bacterium]